MIRNWYDQISHPALKTKRGITKYINWQQFTKGTRGKPNKPTVRDLTGLTFPWTSQHESYHLDICNVYLDIYSKSVKPHPHYFNTDCSNSALLLWFLTVTCSCCPYLYFGSPIMW